MKEERDSFEAMFARNLGNFKAEPRPEVWQHIAKEKAAAKGTKGLSGSAFWFVGSVVLLMGTIWWYYSSNTPVAKPMVASESFVEASLPSMKAPESGLAVTALLATDNRESVEEGLGSHRSVVSRSVVDNRKMIEIPGLNMKPVDELPKNAMKPGISKLKTQQCMPASQAFISSEHKGCAPLEVHFSSMLEGYERYRWEMSDGRVVHTNSFTRSFHEPGKYIVKLFAQLADKLEHVYVDTIVVFSAPQADCELVSGNKAQNDMVYFYNHSKGAKFYEWKLGDSVFSNEIEPVRFAEQLAGYSLKLKVWSENNCADSVVITNPTEVESEFYILMPNAFTPSMSGPIESVVSAQYIDRRLFFPKSAGVEDYKLLIFSKTGAKVFETGDVKQAWNGYYKQKLLPQDVYVWKLEGRFANGQTFNKVGNVLLLYTNN